MKLLNPALLASMVAMIGSDGSISRRKRRLGHGLSTKQHQKRKKKSQAVRASRRKNR